HQPTGRLHEPASREARHRSREAAVQSRAGRRLPAPMKSISARLTAWYALTATITVALLFAVGYFLLEKHLIHGLDLLNAAEFEQIKARLGPDYKALSPPVIDERIRETTEYASVLFYIDIHEKDR